MTVTDEGNLVYRRHFSSEVGQTCVKETKALESFKKFLGCEPCLLIGVDEEELAVLVEKLRKNDLKHVKGFTDFPRLSDMVEKKGRVKLEDFFEERVESSIWVSIMR